MKTTMKTTKENGKYYTEYQDRKYGIMYGWGETKKESIRQSLEQYYIKKFT
jgi:hypothetical protein